MDPNLMSLHCTHDQHAAFTRRCRLVKAARRAWLNYVKAACNETWRRTAYPCVHRAKTVKALLAYVKRGHKPCGLCAQKFASSTLHHQARYEAILAVLVVDTGLAADEIAGALRNHWPLVPELLHIGIRQREVSSSHPHESGDLALLTCRTL
jgi:hypothetical protein